MGKQVLLYSGGMDSFITAYAFPDARLLYLDTGSRYAGKEIKNLVGVGGRTPVIDNRLDLSDVERFDLIVPARNLLLVTLASYYGNEILLAATAGDKSTDKDAQFAGLASVLLTHIYASHHFPNHGAVVITLPFKEMSKGQMVGHYLKSGGDPQALASTISCYHPSLLHCGLCKACIRKWVALKVHGIDKLVPWAADPALYPGWLEVTQKIKAGGWRCEQEDQETLWALQNS
jgi:7-cyano-7-deazaguanine synthase